MTKFEQEFDEKIMPHKDNLDLMKVRKHFKCWHSDEEYQALKEDYNDQADSILLMLEEIGSLKSQLQQQVLPVVPECVAKDVKRLPLKVLADWGRSVSWISKETKEWLAETGNTNVFLGKSWILCSLKINGFTVEKTQTFEVVLAQTENNKWLLRKNGNTIVIDCLLKSDMFHSCQFTVSEIKSIDERFLAFKVPVESEVAE